jgi:hypothetical protein
VSAAVDYYHPAADRAVIICAVHDSSLFPRKEVEGGEQEEHKGPVGGLTSPTLFDGHVRRRVDEVGFQACASWARSQNIHSTTGTAHAATGSEGKPLPVTMGDGAIYAPLDRVFSSIRGHDIHSS